MLSLTSTKPVENRKSVTAKNLYYKILPSALANFLRALKHRLMMYRFLLTGRVPFSMGYGVFKVKKIQSILENAELMQAFRRGDRLPKGFGVGLDERCIEYPWLLSRLNEGPELLLDAGSVLNKIYLLKNPLLQNKKIHILTLAPEEECYWESGISYIYEDLRSLPMKENLYDTIVCISTLEHIGCDNTDYTKNQLHRENRPQDYVAAIKELRRVLKPGGNLFLTVPFGAYQHLGMLQQFDSKMLRVMKETFGQEKIEESFYRYNSGGWRVADEDECSDCRYVEWNANSPHAHSTEKDLAVAAHAVACIWFKKE
jgi:SAM-dependent methyltransferase